MKSIQPAEEHQDRGSTGGRTPLKFLCRSLPLLVSLAGFITLAAWQLDRPGWYADEMLFVQGALPRSEMTTGALVTWHGIPIRVFPYIGALKAWIYTPIFAIWDLDLPAMRWPAILLSVVTLGVTFCSIRRWLGVTCAVSVALLCAVNPSFIMQSRVDWGPVVLMWLCKAIAMALLFRWLIKPQWLSWNLAGCGLFLGLGFFDKYNFIWVILAYGLATLTVFFPECWKAARTVPRLAWAGLAMGALGAVWVVKSMILKLLLLPDLSQIGARVQTIWGIHARTESGGDIGRFWFKEFPRTTEWAGGLMIILAIVLLVFVGLQMWRRERSLRSFSSRFELRLALWCLVVWAALFAQIVLTPQAGGPHHVAVLFPFDLLAVAALARYLWCENRALPMERKRLAVIFGVGVGIWVTICGIGLAPFYQRFGDVSAFKNQWSPRMQALADFLGKIGKNYDVIDAVDWGFDKPLQAITPKPIRWKVISHWPIFRDWSATDTNFSGRISRVFPRRQRLLFLLHRKDGEVFPECRVHFFEMNRLRGNVVVPLTKVPPEVAAVYELYTVKRAFSGASATIAEPRNE